MSPRPLARAGWLSSSRSLKAKAASSSLANGVYPLTAAFPRSSFFKEHDGRGLLKPHRGRLLGPRPASPLQLLALPAQKVAL